jgi:hypothetical protein
MFNGLHHGMVSIGHIDIVTMLKPIDPIVQGLFGFADLSKLCTHDVGFFQMKNAIETRYWSIDGWLLREPGRAWGVALGTK